MVLWKKFVYPSICLVLLLFFNEYFGILTMWLGSPRLNETEPLVCEQGSLFQVVDCLDDVYQEYVSLQNGGITRKEELMELHFVFIGDSRIRQHFFNFLRLIPDYDRITQPDPIPFFIHEDVEFTSKILRLRISFFWRPLINENVTHAVLQWSLSSRTERPYMIFLGMEVHHMLKTNGANFELYKKKVKELGEILGQISDPSKVVWLNQYPTVDPNHYDIFSEKIYRYNQAVRQILRSQSNIRIWDSSNWLAEEYVRSCAVNSQRETIGEFSAQYVSCNDYIHTGYSALAQATQLLINDICNKKQWQKL